MRELYIEGVAIHGGPESCVGAREGVGEALAGVVRAGLLSREINQFGVPTLVPSGGRQYRWRRYRESLADPARSENLGTHGSLHAREPGGPVVTRPGGWAGREGNAEAVSPRCTIVGSQTVP